MPNYYSVTSDYLIVIQTVFFKFFSEVFLYGFFQPQRILATFHSFWVRPVKTTVSIDSHLMAALLCNSDSTNTVC